MFAVFESLLDAGQLRQLRQSLLPASFSDGALTAHGDAQKVKRNLQLTASHPAWKASSDLVLEAIKACVPLMQYMTPVNLTPPLFNLYDEGMYYGKHTDAAIMSAGGMPMRTDYSITVFLSSPDEYDGGELVFSAMEEAPLAAKLKAGNAVVYPSNTLHEVRPVTRGQRFAAILWAQSALPGEPERRVLQDLDRVRALMDEGQIDGAKERLRLARENLVRLLARP